MSSKTTKKYDNKNAELKIVVSIEEKVWKEEQKKSFEKLSKKLKLKGYRAGKVPLEIAKKSISKHQIWEEAISKLLNKAVQDAAKEIDMKKDIVLDSPTYAVEKVTENELEITFIYPIFPEVKFKKYDNYKIKFTEPTEKDIKEAVKKQINDLLSRGTLLLPKEGKDAKVENGDTIIFDFKGFVDDKAFEGGEAEKYELKIGSGTFIPGFEDQLVGKKLGWEGSINVKFPNEYFKEDLRNKTAKFEIKIHEIKYNDKQKLTEDFIKNLNIPDVKTEKELNDYLSSLTKKELIEKERTNFMNEFVTKIVADNEIPVPRTIVLKELQALMKKFEENLKNQGFTKKEYYEVTGYTDEKVKEELMNEAKKAVQKSMIYSIIAKELNIKPTEEDFNRQYQRFGKLYGINPEMAYQMLKKEQIEPALINELVIDKLVTTLNPSIKIEKEKVTFVPKKTEDKPKENKKDSNEEKSNNIKKSESKK